MIPPLITLPTQKQLRRMPLWFLMLVYVFVGALVLTGCDKRHSVMEIVSGSGQIITTPTHLTVLVAGQSNAARFTSAYGQPDFLQVLRRHYTDLTVEFINCAQPGSAISQWQPGSPFVSNCLSMSQGKHIDVLFWWQGESDAVNNTDPTTFESLTLSTWGAFSYSKFVFAQIATNNNGVANWDTIKQAQLSMMTSDRLMIQTDDLPMEDSVHVALSAQSIVGQRLAAKYLNL